jgi:hypothetical protein
MARFKYTLLVFIITFMGTIGCGAKPVDYEARFDDDVETTWTKKWKWVDAVQYLEKGGVYVDTGDSEDAALDRPRVLPILKRLQREFGMEWEAVLDQSQSLALAVVARLPNDASARAKIEAVLAEEQRQFPGAILQQWGHKWLSLDFLNEEQAKYMEDLNSEEEPASRTRHN